MSRGEVKIALFAFLATLFIKHGSSSTLVGRIVDGVEAREDEGQYHVEMFYQFGGNGSVPFPYCGGALYRRKVVITAAHCLKEKDIKYLSVGAGSHNLKSPMMVKKRVVAKQEFGYDIPSKQRDLVLLGLEDEYDLEYVDTIYIVDEEFNGNGKRSRVSGYGLTEYHGADRPTKLRRVDVEYHSDDLCEEMYEGHTTLYNRTVMGCAGGGSKDACQGDSGGPLACKNKKGVYKLAGVVSFGIKCATPGVPGAYTKLQAFKDEIDCKADILEGKREDGSCEYTDFSNKKRKREDDDDEDDDDDDDEDEKSVKKQKLDDEEKNVEDPKLDDEKEETTTANPDDKD